MNRDTYLKVSAAVGVGLVLWGGYRLYRQRKGLGDTNPFITRKTPQAALVSSYTSGGMKTEMRADRDMPIEQRIATIQDLVYKSVQDPKMRKLALDITHKCPERDGTCEARAIYDAVKGRIRYTGDIAAIKHGAKGPHEGIDLYQSAWRTWEFKGGDCDDHAVLLSTLLALNGIEPRLRVTAESARSDWGHIYAGALLPKHASTGKFTTLDTTLPGTNKFGVEVPYAKGLDFPA